MGMSPVLALILLVFIAAGAVVVLATTSKNKVEKISQSVLTASLVILFWLLFGAAHFRF
jgi:hypothetical protein